MKVLYILFLIRLVFGFHITCRFNFGIDWFVIGRVYTCDVVSMNHDNSSSLTSYDGSHLNGNSSLDVKMIYFRSNYCPDFNLTFVPKGLKNFFPNIIALYFSKCSIDVLNGNEFDEHETLEWVAFEFSNLTRLPGNLFQSTSNVKYINLSDNMIQNVAEDLLKDLQHLEQARFLRNDCINSEARNPSQIPTLIEALKSQCPDIEPETTTAISTVTVTFPEVTTTPQTNEPPKCEIYDFENFICSIEEEFEILKENDAKLFEENQNLREKIEHIEGKNDMLVENNDKLSTHVQDLRNEIEKINAKLFDLQHEIIDCCYFRKKINEKFKVCE